MNYKKYRLFFLLLFFYVLTNDGCISQQEETRQIVLKLKMFRSKLGSGSIDSLTAFITDKMRQTTISEYSFDDEIMSKRLRTWGKLLENNYKIHFNGKDTSIVKIGNDPVIGASTIRLIKENNDWRIDAIVLAY